jgi:hypothetical protein
MLAKFLRKIGTNEKEYVEYLPADFVVPTGYEVVDLEVTQEQIDALSAKPATLKPFNGLYPHIESIAPNKFFINVPTNVVILGGNFDRTTKIVLDGNYIETQYVSDKEIRAVINYDEEGQLKLGVCNGDLNTYVNVDMYSTYLPNATPDLIGWWDASTKDEMSEVNMHINTWSTKGGPVLAMGQSALAEQPQWIPNQYDNLGMLYFSEGDDMTAMVTENYDDLTFYVVFKCKTNKQGTLINILPTTQSYGNFAYVNRFDNGDVFATFDNSSGNNDNDDAIDENFNKNKIHVFEARVTSNTVRLRVDDKYQNSYTENRSQGLVTKCITIGELCAGGANYEGYIGEVIVYKRSLTDIEANQVYDYLLSKWGVAGE